MAEDCRPGGCHPPTRPPPRRRAGRSPAAAGPWPGRAPASPVRRADRAPADRQRGDAPPRRPHRRDDGGRRDDVGDGVRRPYLVERHLLRSDAAYLRLRRRQSGEDADRVVPHRQGQCRPLKHRPDVAPVPVGPWARPGACPSSYACPWAGPPGCGTSTMKREAVSVPSSCATTRHDAAATLAGIGDERQLGGIRHPRDRQRRACQGRRTQGAAVRTPSPCAIDHALAASFRL